MVMVLYIVNLIIFVKLQMIGEWNIKYYTNNKELIIYFSTILAKLNIVLF